MDYFRFFPSSFVSKQNVRFMAHNVSGGKCVHFQHKCEVKMLFSFGKLGREGKKGKFNFRNPKFLFHDYAAFVSVCMFMWGRENVKT